MAELEAKRRDFCCVRINLNEGDVRTDLDFFRKLFHSVLMAAFGSGAYGGRKSPTFFSYLELNASGTLSDLEQMPLICAIIIASAVKSGNINLNVPDDMLQEDLINIRSELKKPILILVDECNVLRENRIILEKLRNIFMNMTGFMLMFAATDDFFPVMDEVFSPIMRQFKRIDIGPFKGEDDVKQCIRGPLERLLLSERDVRNLAPSPFISEVEALSGRKPYEIQLICHELFKRCQEGKSKRFSLNLNTLESIQEVLARGQNINDRPLLKTARKMRSSLFQVLDAACGGTEQLDIADTWRVEYLLNGESRWNEEQYFKNCSELEALGFIRVEPGAVSFCGDQFDRIYLKYLARSKAARLSLAGLSADDFIFASFGRVAEELEGLRPIAGARSDGGPQDITPIIDCIGGAQLPTDCDLTPLFEGILLGVMYQDVGSSVRLFELRFKGDIGSGQAWFIWQDPEHVAGLKKLRKRFDEIRKNGTKVQTEIEILSWDLRVPSPLEVSNTVQALGDEHLATRVANELMDMVQFFYVRQRDKMRAMEVAKAAFRLQQSRLHPSANNVGYLYMDHRDFDEARLWLQAAIQYAEENEQQLYLYNSGVLYALTGDYVAAKFELSRAKEQRQVGASCAQRLYVDENGKLMTIEVLEPPSLLALIDEALDAISAMSEQSVTYQVLS
ncbi:hypothetical protein AC244_26245 [Ensifer adhaerens]|uniref:Tetratricopeptide repeat protein n=2 Tax=Ensifer adhaerens TaxID=106592 RepID=A0A0L8BIX9_ENSAD|nr:hypothetical protein AC244_26245 [Ensifer adhaerens]